MPRSKLTPNANIPPEHARPDDLLTTRIKAAMPQIKSAAKAAADLLEDEPKTPTSNSTNTASSPDPNKDSAVEEVLAIVRRLDRDRSRQPRSEIRAASQPAASSSMTRTWIRRLIAAEGSEAQFLMNAFDEGLRGNAEGVQATWSKAFKETLSYTELGSIREQAGELSLHRFAAWLDELRDEMAASAEPDPDL